MRLDIKLNNKPYNLKDGLSLHDLIQILNLNPDGIVTEVNLQIVKKQNRDEIILKNGDKVEIITFMGGG